ncbi:hypothetical protein [Alkalimarinus alittae]|uniref:Uncharacterized protein n=1 Tax=Alkalimarinus alittae TaxID=2961619 RepID=A0ABY6MX75_9ALTE|nr:hypothetical protein [Alkalimarinus alittae]UZE94410.1 hypothetical protein NKI27_09910 [Alkalimarinus alittae]
MRLRVSVGDATPLLKEELDNIEGGGYKGERCRFLAELALTMLSTANIDHLPIIDADASKKKSPYGCNDAVKLKASVQGLLNHTGTIKRKL